MAKKAGRIDDLSDVNFDFIGKDMDMNLIDKVIKEDSNSIPEKEVNEELATSSNQKIEEVAESSKDKEKKKEVQKQQKNDNSIAPKSKSENNGLLINLNLEKNQEEGFKRKQVLLQPEIYERLNNFKSDMYIKHKIRIEYVDLVNKVLDQVLKHYGH